MTLQARTRKSRRATSGASSHTLESPIDHAKTYEVAWQQVSDLFSAARRVSNASFVYVISEGDDGPVKIGRAKDPVKRLRNMQTGNSRRLRIEFVLLGGKNLERLLHEMWEPSAIRSAFKQKKLDTSPGTEWFKPEIRAELSRVLKTAVKNQIAYIESDEEKGFDRATEIVYEAHIEHGVKVHERDESRLLAQGVGYAVKNQSLVKFFRAPDVYRDV